MHFNLSLGRAFGGTVVAKPIMLWLDPFLRTTLADLIVWPNRIVVPLSYDPDFDYSILEMRCGSEGTAVTTKDNIATAPGLYVVAD